MKSAVNDITKQKIRSRPISKKYQENYDKIKWTSSEDKNKDKKCSHSPVQ